MKQVGSRGVSMIIVLAALIVTGLLGAAMLKLSSGGQMSNGNYSSSATARSAAQSGITAAIQSLEALDPEANVVPKLQNWIDVSRGTGALAASSQWLFGAANSWELLDGKMEYKVQIVGFDPQNCNVALRAEGKGRGGSRAVATAVYHLEGLEYRTTEYPNNALQADGGIHECNPEKLTINGNSSIAWAGFTAETGMNSHVVFDGKFRTDGTAKQFKNNGFLHFMGASYFGNLSNRPGATSACYSKYYAQTHSDHPTSVVAPHGQVVSSIEALGMPVEPDPAITFNRAVLTPYVKDVSGIEDQGGAYMNSLWENTPAAQKYRGEYLVLKINNQGWDKPFKNDGVAFKYKAIVLSEGATALSTFYESSPAAFTCLYIDHYRNEAGLFNDIRNFNGYVHLNDESVDAGNGVVIKREYGSVSIADFASLDNTKLDLTIWGSVYSTENAQLRFEGVRLKYTGGTADNSLWSNGVNHRVYAQGVLGKTVAVSTDHSLIRVVEGAKFFYPGDYTVRYNEAMMKKIVDDKIISVGSRSGSNSGSWLTGTLATKPGVSKIVSRLVSQSM